MHLEQRGKKVTSRNNIFSTRLTFHIHHDDSASYECFDIYNIFLPEIGMHETQNKYWTHYIQI